MRPLIAGERLSSFSHVWKKMKAAPELVQLVRCGYRIQFVRGGRPKLSQPDPRKETRLPPDQMKVAQAEVTDLVRKGALRVLSRLEAEKKPGFYSKVFCVPKDSGGMRPVINLKPLNKYVVKQTFRMETLKKVRSALRPGMWATTLDLSDAYYHVSIHKKSRRYLRFILDGKIYEFKALPMGLCSSPRIFTRLTKFVSGFCRRYKIVLIMYLDDLLILGESYEDCKAKTRFVENLLTRLGFLINLKKSVLEPKQEVTYLGCRWDLRSWTVALKESREIKLRMAAAELRTETLVTCRKIASFLGKAISAHNVVPLARARVRRTQWEFLANCRSPGQYNDLMWLSQEAKEELLWWERLAPGISLPITLPEAEQTLDTDASDVGIGIYFEGDLLSEKAPAETHICAAELQALDRALTRLDGKIKPGVLCWRVDNNSALAAIANEGSTHSWELSCLAVSILKRAEGMGVHIKPVRVSSEENILADAASRFKKVPDWSLKQRTMDRIAGRWGKPDIDLMATEESRKAPFYFSWRSCDASALAINALAEDVDWRSWQLPYCFPPFPLIDQVGGNAHTGCISINIIMQVLQKAAKQEIEKMVLVVPWWVTKPFFASLQVTFLQDGLGLW